MTRAKVNVLGVIIAREGSKGVPGKNMARIGKNTLLGYAIEAAKKSKLLTDVLLSTDSFAMARYGKNKGVEVPFIRPAHLAEDKTHTPPVIQHAVLAWEKITGRRVDVVVTLQPTSPFRRAAHIDAAVGLLLKNPSMDSVITVKPATFPPFWLLRQRKNVLLPFVQDGTDYSLKERQQLPPVLQPNGAVFVSRRKLLIDRGLIYSLFAGGRTGFVIMDPLSSVDVDHKQDLVMARSIFSQHPELVKK